MSHQCLSTCYNLQARVQTRHPGPRVRTQKTGGFFGYTHLKKPTLYTLYATNNEIFYCFKAFKALSYWVFFIILPIFSCLSKKPNKPKNPNGLGFLKKPGFFEPCYKLHLCKSEVCHLLTSGWLKWAGRCRRSIASSHRHCGSVCGGGRDLRCCQIQCCCRNGGVILCCCGAVRHIRHWCFYQLCTGMLCR